MADAMRRGIELDHPLDGGSDNQSSMLQGQRQGQRQETRQEPEPMQRQEPREENRRISRSYEQEQEPQRRESVQVQKRIYQRLWTRKKNFRVLPDVWVIKAGQRRELQAAIHHIRSVICGVKEHACCSWPAPFFHYQNRQFLDSILEDYIRHFK